MKLRSKTKKWSLVLLDKFEGQPVLALRNWYRGKHDSGLLIFMAALLLLALYHLSCYFIDGNASNKNHAIGIVTIECLLVGLFAFQRLLSFVLFYPDGIINGTLLKRWTFFSPTKILYCSVSSIEHKRVSFRPALVINSNIIPYKIVIVRGWNKSSLEEPLRVLARRLDGWIFDEKAKELARGLGIPLRATSS